MAHRRIYRSVGFVLLVIVMLSLAIGCGGTEEPTATSAPATQKPPEPAAQPAEPDSALEEYSQAISLDPQDAEAYNSRGLAYSDRGDLDRAIADYDQAIALDPRFAPAYLNRGLAHVTTGQYDQALADFGKVLELDPANAQAYYVCGQVYAALGEREEAIAYLERALDLGLNPEMKQYAEELLKELGKE